MKISKNKLISLDRFIDKALYNKKIGYYMNRDPFGKNGDFITAPNISILFSEMISVWCIAFWESLGSPKKINIVELGSGNGEMMRQMIKVFERFNSFKKSCNYYILEKSHFLKKIQRKKLANYNVKWISSLNKLNNGPNVFLANEFFDALPIKQFIKKNNKWFEKKIKTISKNNFEMVETITIIQNLEKKNWN